MQQLTRKIRRSANFGLFGSIAVILVVLIFHFSPWHITYQSQEVFSWMLISGTILAVLAVVMALFSIRNTPRRLRELPTVEQKMQGYSSYISSLYKGSLAIVVIECILMLLMSNTNLLMITILLVLLMVITFPNMYKIKNDLFLTDDEMTDLYGSDYIRDPKQLQ